VSEADLAVAGYEHAAIVGAAMCHRIVHSADIAFGYGAALKKNLSGYRAHNL
jgi:hypothetical protein